MAAPKRHNTRQLAYAPDAERDQPEWVQGITVPREQKDRWCKYVDKPRDWDRAVRAAAMWHCGMNKTAIDATNVVSKNTLTLWQQSSWWPEAVEYARTVWFERTTMMALGNIGAAIEKGNIDIARWFLERVEPRLRPTARMEHTGKDGGPIEVEDARRQLIERLDRELATRERRITAGDNGPGSPGGPEDPTRVEILGPGESTSPKH